VKGGEKLINGIDQTGAKSWKGTRGTRRYYPTLKKKDLEKGGGREAFRKSNRRGV